MAEDEEIKLEKIYILLVFAEILLLVAGYAVSMGRERITYSYTSSDIPF